MTCPKCGSTNYLRFGDIMKCLDCCLSESLDCIIAERNKLKAIVEQLPKTADGGVVYPGMCIDEWVVDMLGTEVAQIKKPNGDTLLIQTRYLQAAEAAIL